MRQKTELISKIDRKGKEERKKRKKRKKKKEKKQRNRLINSNLLQFSGHVSKRILAQMIRGIA